ncbi:hypothetical protein [Mediterranea massiliensis]|uniref:hypothetical protein n=1 Tax=Mediterranea massiliensis TaxID=1841865 RepID=UPI0025A47ACA|nr:hypothetical protein [Mediterranea massiliensis]MDM8336372.1 hypothetical protein [Mediterranea massiliensis]
MESVEINSNKSILIKSYKKRGGEKGGRKSQPEASMKKKSELPTSQQNCNLSPDQCKIPASILPSHHHVRTTKNNRYGTLSFLLIFI